jgi:hypothetical protein
MAPPSHSPTDGAFRILPVRTLKRRCHFLHQPGRKRRLANAPHAQDRHQSRAVLEDPLGEYGQLLSAANEPEHVRCLAPILAPVPRRRRTCGKCRDRL